MKRDSPKVNEVDAGELVNICRVVKQALPLFLSLHNTAGFDIALNTIIDAWCRMNNLDTSKFCKDLIKTRKEFGDAGKDIFIID